MYLPDPAARENPEYRRFSKRNMQRISEKGVILDDIIDPEVADGKMKINLEAGRHLSSSTFRPRILIHNP